MALVEHSLVMVLSSLLVAGSCGFPSLRLLFQDGQAGNNIKTRSGLHRESLLAAAGQWEWMAAGEARHESPLLPRRKRDTVVWTKRSADHPIPTTAGLLVDDETTDPGSARTGSSTEAPVMSSTLSGGSTEAATARALGHLRAASPRGQTPPVTLSEEFTETTDTQTSSPPPYTLGPTELTSTASSQTSPTTSAISVVASGLDSKTGVNRKIGSTSSSASPPMANPKPSPTVQAMPPPKEDPRGPDKMLMQCLLAISLLALVAGVFIITTFVLATLLWRQKRAYKLRQRQPTEMVCISSLLAAEEAEASDERLSRVKRVKMLAENGSEADMDNLTLNSFLPDH